MLTSLFFLFVGQVLSDRPNLAKGAVAACFIKRGMSEKEVQRMVGVGLTPPSSGKGYGVSYPECGLSVCFDWRGRVTAASLSLHLDCPDGKSYEPTWWFLEREWLPSRLWFLDLPGLPPQPDTVEEMWPIQFDWPWFESDEAIAWFRALGVVLLVQIELVILAP